jgi:hypothetical protein
MRGGSNAEKKPPALCQCMDPATGKPCKHLATEGSLFCKQHPYCPAAPTNGYEPDYDPEGWNKDPAIYKSMNCYAYAMNVRDPKLIGMCRQNNGSDCRKFFPQPGALNGDRYALNASERRNCKVVEKLMMADVPDIERSTYFDKCPAGKSKIAMVVHEKQDYHFYRQNPDGSWSHKDGSNKVKDFDALKRKIFNPQAAARDYRWQGSDLNYDNFCGFYCAPRDREILLGQGGASRRRWTARAAVEKAESALEHVAESAVAQTALEAMARRSSQRSARKQSGGIHPRQTRRHPRSGIPF